MPLLRITHQLNQNHSHHHTTTPPHHHTTTPPHHHTTTPQIQKSSYSLITSLLLPHFRTKKSPIVICLAAPACLTTQSSTTPWSLVAMSIMPTSQCRSAAITRHEVPLSIRFSTATLSCKVRMFLIFDIFRSCKFKIFTERRL